MRAYLQMLEDQHLAIAPQDMQDLLALAETARARVDLEVYGAADDILGRYNRIRCSSNRAHGGIGHFVKGRRNFRREAPNFEDLQEN